MIKKWTHKDALPEIEKHISQEIDGIIYTVAEKNFICIGRNAEFNQNAVDALSDYEVIKPNYEGGVIVEQAGDIDILLFTHGFIGQDMRKEIVLALQQLCIENGVNAEIVGNDFLVDGKKCASWGSRIFGKMLYAALHISLNVDMDVIKAVCTKPMYKVPRGLCQFGIKPDDVYAVIEQSIENIKIQEV